MSLTVETLDKFADFALRLAQAARIETLSRFRSNAVVSNKASADFDPVTDADRKGEEAIAALIQASYPDHLIIGEEFGQRGGDGPYRWILDPVDGTRAFVCGSPTWATLIALEYEERPVVGLIDQPYIDDLWLSWGGRTQFMRNGNRTTVRTSGVQRLSEARISTTDPRLTEAGGYMDDVAATAFAELARAARLTRFSFDAYGYGLLASGELDIVAETSLQLHDYAALVPVIEGAGGVVTNWRGERVGHDGKGEILAAATPQLHAAALEILSKTR